MKIDLEGETVSIEELARAWKFYKRAANAYTNWGPIAKEYDIDKALRDAYVQTFFDEITNKKLAQYKEMLKEPDPQGL